MTEKMETALRHIKSSLDVDPWAVEEVERIFMAVDDIKAEIEDERKCVKKSVGNFRAENVVDVIDYIVSIIDRHIGERSSE